MVIDSATSGAQTPAKHSLPELEIYSYLVVLIFLIDQKRYSEVRVHNITLGPVSVMMSEHVEHMNGSCLPSG